MLNVTIARALHILSIVHWIRGAYKSMVKNGRNTKWQKAAMRRRGFEISPHTAGTNSALFETALPLVDWVGFDVKAPFDGYRGVTVANAGAKARAFLEVFVGSGVAYEVRRAR